MLRELVVQQHRTMFYTGQNSKQISQLQKYSLMMTHNILHWSVLMILTCLKMQNVINMLIMMISIAKFQGHFLVRLGYILVG